MALTLPKPPHHFSHQYGRRAAVCCNRTAFICRLKLRLVGRVERCAIRRPSIGVRPLPDLELGLRSFTWLPPSSPSVKRLPRPAHPARRVPARRPEHRNRVRRPHHRTPVHQPLRLHLAALFLEKTICGHSARSRPGARCRSAWSRALFKRRSAAGLSRSSFMIACFERDTN